MSSDSSWLVPDLFAAHDDLLDVPALHRGAVGTYLSPLYRLSRLWRARIGSRRALRESADLIPGILRQIAPIEGAPPPESWRVIRAAWTITDVAVLALGPDGTPLAVAKLPHTPDGMTHLRRQRVVLATLHGEERLGEWRALLPSPLAEGEIRGQAYLVEEALAGVELRALQRKGQPYAAGLISAARSIGHLHRVTAETIVVGPDEMDRWVDAPLRLIERLSTLLPRAARIDSAISLIRSELHDALTGREVTAGWIHGDLWPGNVLVTADGRQVRGIVDWGRAAADELPMHDAMQLLMHTSHLVNRHTDLGSTVRSLLRDPSLGDEERALLRSAPLPFELDPDGLRHMILLYWLRYLATYLVKCPDKVRNQWWVRRNVSDVLRVL